MTGASGNGGTSLRARLKETAIAAMLKLWVRLLRRPLGRLNHYDLIFRTWNFGTLRWANRNIWQSPLDLWTLQETLSELQPALLIETGTHQGGSALFYANLMDALGTGRVLTIDIVEIHDLDHERIECLHGSSTDPAIVEEVSKRVAAADGPVFVILDGDHDRDHVAQELELYSQFVTPGSYLLSQDGIIDEFWLFRHLRPGPLPANREFLKRHPEFEHDRERNERLGASQHPCGWMRRLPD